MERTKRILTSILAMASLSAGATSVVGSLHFEDSSQIVLSSDFTKSFFRPSAQVRDEDRGVALATLAMSLGLDHYARRLNKFEEVPEYRVRHVVSSLLEPERLSRSETQQDIYDRMMAAWRTSCAARREKDSPCTLGIRFTERDWKTPLPDYARPISQSEYDSVTDAAIDSQYRTLIDSFVADLCRQGQLKFDDQLLACDLKIESRAEVRQRVVAHYKEMHLRGYYRKTRMGLYRTQAIQREIRQHAWGEVSFRLESPPARLTDFQRVLKDRLNHEYLKRVRSQIAYGLLYESLGAMGTVTLPRDVDAVLADERLTRRRARFALLSIDLRDVKADQLSEGLDLVITRLSNENVLERARMERTASELNAALAAKGLRTHLAYRDYAAAHAAVFRGPTDALESQLHARLFRREIEGTTDEGLTGTEHTYFVDTPAQKLTVIALLEENFIGRERVSGSDPRLDHPLVAREASQNKMNSAFRKVMDRLIDRTDILLKNGALIRGRSEDMSPKALKAWMKASLDKKLTEPRDLLEFQEHLFASPLRPTHMKSAASEKSDSALPRLGDFLRNFFPNR